MFDHGKETRDFYISSLRAENKELKRLLQLAHGHLCSNVCSSVWKTGDKPKHHETCIKITEALKGDEQ
jgi:hypothetical protein